MSTTSPDELTPIEDATPGEGPQVMTQIRRLWQSETGLAPILVGLAALLVYFTIRSSVFLSAGNITNLFIQATIFILLGMAEIWLLLMGDIDLSIGYSAGIGGCLAVILTNTVHHWSIFLALPLSILACTLISTLWGVICVYLRLPSFIVTLAGQIGLLGVLLYLIDSQGGAGGSLPVQEKVLYDLVNANLTPFATWIVILASVVVLSLLIVRGEQRRRSAGLGGKPVWVTLLKVGVLLAAGVWLVLVFNTNRSSFTELEGMPFAIPIDLGVLAIGTFILTKTRAGRYIYAIGGNVEAARRAGIYRQSVPRPRLRVLGDDRGRGRDCCTSRASTGSPTASTGGTIRPLRGGRGGHRRDEPVRRPRQDDPRGDRRIDHRHHRQRDGADQRERRRTVHGHRPRPARRGRRGLDRSPQRRLQ